MQFLKRVLLIISVFLFLTTCSDDIAPEVILLVADAGENQNGKVGDLIVLDGSGSSGPSGYTSCYRSRIMVTQDYLISYKNIETMESP